MKPILIFLTLPPLLLLGACKTTMEEKKISASIYNLDTARTSMRSIFGDTLGYQIIRCPPEMKSPPMKYSEQYCFTVSREPEEILSEISSEMSRFSSLQMQWRLDFGLWVSTYNFDGEKFGALVALKSPGNSPFLRDNPDYADIKTFGDFIISDERNKKP